MDIVVEVVGDPQSALDFLVNYGGPWQLHAIDPERKKKIVTQTFDKGQEQEMLAWLKHWVGKRNLYFSVNVPPEGKEDRAKKGAMVDGYYMGGHVDVDPNAPPKDCADADAHYAAERAIILEKLRAYEPRPSVIVDSGGGYQGYWLFKEPVEIKSLEHIASLEALNRRVEKDLGGDHCFDVTRIMRIPGTVNLPDAKKRAKGRKPALASVVDADWERLYDETFVAPWAEEGKAKKPAPGAKANGRAPAEGFPLPEWAQRVLAAGPDHEGDRSYGGDRSKALWAVTCTMVRRNWSEDDIVEAILDKSNKLSEHVYHQSNPEKYARRQAERAKEQAGGEFVYTSKGAIVSNNQDNIRNALKILEISLSYDEFADTLMMEGPGGQPLRVMNDSDLTKLYLDIDQEVGFRPAADYFRDVVSNECRKKSFHPVRQHFDSLKWDGTDRLETWLIDCAGAADTPFIRAVSKLFIIGMVRRIRQPGSKFDEMLVLESQQGYDKSTAFRLLAIKPEWFTDSLPLNVDDKTVIEQTRGKLLIEVGELKGMKRGDIEHLKAFLSRQNDRARLAFGRITTEVGRQFGIAGTTNSSQYLRDGTGNRRFWPVKVDKFDIPKLAKMVDQLWAEAVAREAAGESSRLSPELYEAAALEQERRYIDDPWSNMLEKHLSRFDFGRILIADMWLLLKIPTGQQTQEHNARLGDAMRKMGWERFKLRPRGAEDRRSHWYYAKGDTPEKRRPEIHISIDEYGKVDLVQDDVEIDVDTPTVNDKDIPF